MSKLGSSASNNGGQNWVHCCRQQPRIRFKWTVNITSNEHPPPSPPSTFCHLTPLLIVECAHLHFITNVFVAAAATFTSNDQHFQWKSVGSQVCQNYGELGCIFLQESWEILWFLFFKLLERNCDSTLAGKLPGARPGNRAVWSSVSVEIYVGFKTKYISFFCPNISTATLQHHKYWLL